MRFTNRKRSSSAVIDFTPLIDCMFLLVIFIMVISRFEADGGIEVNLPSAQAAGQGVQEKPERINITVDSDGNIFIEQEEVAAEAIASRIEQARAAATNADNLILVVYGDRVAHHGKIVEVLDAAQKANQLKVVVRTVQ